jgi:hypothetical protein
MTWFQGLDQAPEIIRICHESWVRMNPDWEVILLDRHSISAYFETSSVIAEDRTDITLQQESDVLRLNLLARYGGVWADATCYCTLPLNSWLPGVMKTGFFVFRDPGPDRILGNWFIASVPGCFLTESFCEAYNKLIKNTVFTRQSHAGTRKLIVKLSRKMRKRGLPLDWLASPLAIKTFKAYPYLLFHYYLAYRLKRDTRGKQIFYEMPYVTASLPFSLKLLLRKRLGPEEIRRRIVQLDPPMQKLNWKHPKRYRTATMNMEEYLSFVTGR